MTTTSHQTGEERLATNLITSKHRPAYELAALPGAMTIVLDERERRAHTTGVQRAKRRLLSSNSASPIRLSVDAPVPHPLLPWAASGKRFCCDQ
jgi:hypothetical protein